MRCSHFGPRSNDTGGTHCRGAASEIGRTGRRCGGYRYAGYPHLASYTPGQSTASSLVPEVGAECVSSARSDLCGGRPNPKGEGCPYRDRSSDHVADHQHMRWPRSHARLVVLPRLRARSRCVAMLPSRYDRRWGDDTRERRVAAASGRARRAPNHPLPSVSSSSAGPLRRSPAVTA